MDRCTDHFENTLTSFSHDDDSKTLLYSLYGRGKGLKADRTCTIFSHLDISLHNHIFMCLQNTYEYIHLTPSTSYSVMNVRVAAQVLSTHSCQ